MRQKKRKHRYIEVNGLLLASCGLISALVIGGASLVTMLGFNVADRVEPNVYADEGIDLNTVEIVEERTIPIIVEVEKPVEVEVEVVKDRLNKRSIGNFNLTAYCSCEICCEKWGGSPEGCTGAIGVGCYPGISFAVDPNEIPYGTKLYVEGVGVGIAVDCGGGIKGNRIDVYYGNHQEALQFGRKYDREVFIIEE